MKVLLLHADDELSRRDRPAGWDLIVDCGRAPDSTYAEWSRQEACRVVSLYDYGEEVEDLHRIRKLLQLGIGGMVDPSGMDWWDVLSLEIVPDLQQVLLAHRLAHEMASDCEIFASRTLPLARVLQRLGVGSVVNLEGNLGSAWRRLRRYSNAVSQLNGSQVYQVLQDKYDPWHSIRRRLAARTPSSRDPVVLLPSAYRSVSRTAVSYAASLPEVQFLLMCARSSGELPTLPPNVRMASLHRYFAPRHPAEAEKPLLAWRALRADLIRQSDEFSSVEAAGVFDRIPSLIRWGLALRTAWSNVFQRENILACLCADDSNLYTRMPLILARKNGTSALACHHGALDSWMAIKTPHADFYLAKGEMERDYLVRTCRVAPQQIILGAPATRDSSPIESLNRSGGDRPWLVFFTEAYHSAGWRSNEVYRELLPRLLDLAQTCKLELVFKLHPFDSAKGHRRVLREFLPRAEAARIRILEGPPSAELWRKTRFALTGQSTVAIDCAIRGIPIFLCGWLRDFYTGYVRQYARFGVGQTLESAAQIAEIPNLLRSQPVPRAAKNKLQQAMAPELLRELLGGTSFLPIAVEG